MDTPPVPKPRSAFPPQNDVLKRPVPLPRTKPPVNHDRVSASNLFRSIGTVSKQITEDVAQKVSNSAKSANEKIERSIIDGSRFAKGTLEKTLTTSKAVRDSVAKSVLEGTKSAGLKLRMSKKSEHSEGEESQRCVSMPAVDLSFFDNIQFHSPLLEQRRYKDSEDPQHLNKMPALQLNASHLDDLSLFSSNSDSNTDTVSNFSHDSRENEQADSSLNIEMEMTYDTPKPSRANSVVSIRSAPEIPERRKKRESVMEVMRQNSLYENWTLPHPSPSSSKPEVEAIPRPSKSTIYEFDPLNNNVTSTKKYEGVSNELLLLESFLIGDTYGTIISTDSGNDEVVYDFSETDYFNPPTPPERFDSLYPNENSDKVIPQVEAHEKETNANWYVSENPAQVSNVDEIKTSSSMMQKFSNILKFDNVLNKSNRQSIQKVEIVQRPALNTLPVAHYCGMLNKVVSGVVEDLFKNSQSRYCILSDQKLMCYSDPTNSLLKEAYTLDNIQSIQVVLPLSSRSVLVLYLIIELLTI